MKTKHIYLFIILYFFLSHRVQAINLPLTAYQDSLISQLPQDIQIKIKQVQIPKVQLQILLGWFEKSPKINRKLLIAIADWAVEISATLENDLLSSIAESYAIRYKVEFNPDNIHLEPHLLKLKEAIQVFRNKKHLNMELLAQDQFFYLKYYRCNQITKEAHKLDSLEFLALEIQNYLEQKEALESLTDTSFEFGKGISDLMLTKAFIHIVLGDSLISSQWIEKSMNTANRVGYKIGKANAIRTKALILNQEEALKSFEHSLTIYREELDSFQESKTLIQYGHFCMEQYKKNMYRPASFSWLNQGIERLKEAESLKNYESCDLYKLLAEAYHHRYNYLDSMIDDNTPKALESTFHYYQKTVKAASEEKDVYCLLTVLTDLSSICNSSVCDQLIVYIKNQIAHLFMEESALLKQANESIAQSELLRKEDAHRQNLFLLGIGTITFLAIGAFGVRMAWVNKEYENAKNKLTALKARMDTHFISNVTLNINSLITQNRKSDASNYLIDFERLCRSILQFSDQDFISLQQELDTLKSYLSLEKLRMKDQLTYEIDVDDTLSVHDLKISSLLLQPFVENAVKHGIKNKKKGHPGHLTVTIDDFDKDYFQCTIKDDGIGIENARKRKAISNQEKKSFGLDITYKRIRAIPGASCAVNDLNPSHKDYPGTKVVIKYPKQYKPLKSNSLWRKILAPSS